ncbi:MAG TPA: MBL fold metallo-hydrolase [Thauera aminoaromatica]|jgi:metallo-beta-lactamase family protein|uniref:MBL fold metallo-hydrolase RNA specificity domain-containing protein n=1 Tax=Thauera TaxID=33057 RepID=UPI0005ADCF5C|nr:MULTISPECIES: MBL fold metallo-hydrolase [Thauera]KIN90414.1 metallo-beta-lactamase superfamily protein [Thauera sp. SWB20]MCK6397340.1 MBL fold metallo-hydrolase [Thauera aminoaromatica]HNC68344.1 MBL fold metallo-hydrolase [Thauera aminoaromatica]HPV61114.1 MBL fold metallo-hydrolase [Thauera aminoaromatica]
MNPTILHHGARDGVTGSCHQLFVEGRNSLLVDCGLFQGAETAPDGRSAADRLEIDFPLEGVGALVLTHVHIDHCGRLPWLLAAGFKGPILCSEPSARLLPTVLADAFAVGVSRDRALIERYLGKVEARIRALPYGKWHLVYRSPDASCRIRLQRAGHILGSAYVECELSGAAWPQPLRVVFSGDLGAPHAPLLPAPRPPWRADVLVLETTYGDRVHENRRDRRARLQAVVEHALEDGGTVIVPAFSIGRTQELLYEFEDILHRQRMRPGPHAAAWGGLRIFLDSPLAQRFTALYRELQPFWDAEARARVRAGRQPLSYDQLVAIDSHEEHLANVRRLARSREPAVVIAASGMCAGGRVVNYLREMLGDPRHDVLFVGYQARGTPGHAIQAYGPRGGYVELDGERVDIRAGIHTLSGYSAHADRDDLTRFVTRMRHLPGEVRLVHGEDGVRAEFARHLQEATGGHVRVVV